MTSRKHGTLDLRKSRHFAPTSAFGPRNTLQPEKVVNDTVLNGDHRRHRHLHHRDHRRHHHRPRHLRHQSELTDPPPNTVQPEWWWAIGAQTAPPATMFLSTPPGAMVKRAGLVFQ